MPADRAEHPARLPVAMRVRRGRTPVVAWIAADLLAAVHLLGVVLARNDWQLGLPLLALGALWTVTAMMLHGRRRPGALVPLAAVVGVGWWVFVAVEGALGAVAGLDPMRAQAAAAVLAVVHLVAPFVIRRRPFEP